MRSSGLSELGQRIEEPPISWLMRMTLEHPKRISLAAGFTDNESLPVQEVQEAFREVLETERAALQYGTTTGDPLLRTKTAHRLEHLDQAAGIKRNIPCPPERILVTNGSQQLLYMITEALCDPGDIVLVEDPTYFVYLGIMQSKGVRGRGIRMEEDGIDLNHLEQTLAELKESGDLPRVKLLYLVTYFQNPTGRTTAFAKKTAALEVLRNYERNISHPIYLLEDAAYRELRFRGEPVASALAVEAAQERVIYAGTYSKPFATGLRVGFGVLPDALYKVVKRIKGNHDFGTANLLQQLLKHALAEPANGGNSLYERHLPELARRYQCKATEMVSSLQQHFPAEVSWQEPSGGLYVWARAPITFKTGAKSQFFNAAIAQDVLFVPGELCYVDDPRRPKPDHEMRLSFGGASLTDIRSGIARLGDVLRSFIHSPT